MPLLTPNDIYLRAVAAKVAEPVPAYVSYRADVRARGARLECIDGRLITTFGPGGSPQAYRVMVRDSGASATSADLTGAHACLGVPLIAPTGGDLAAAVTASSHGTTPNDARSALKVIGSVRVATVFNYDVRSADVESFGDASVYHVVLRALTDPVTYPLTDLYVDVQTFSIRRIVATFVDRYGGVPATIVASGTFEREGPYWIETSEHVEVTAPTQPSATRATLDATASDFLFEGGGG